MPVYVSDLFTATAAPVSANPTPTRSWTWLRSSTTISGATSSTYTATTADIGSTLSVSQFETNLLGIATATSAVTETVQAFDPIRLFSASEPGVWYDPTDAANLAWRRNLLLYTDSFSTGAWAKTSMLSFTQSATTAPDGTTSAVLVTELSATAQPNLRFANAPVISAGTMSVYAKSNGRNFVCLQMYGGIANKYATAVYDLSTVTVTKTQAGTSSTISSPSIVPVGSGWYRLSFSYTTTAPVVSDTYIQLCGSGTPAIDVYGTPALYAGNGTSGTYFWGAQVEEGATLTAYQPITTLNSEVIARFPNTTLYQDASGTIPVSSFGQPVGLMLDKSRGGPGPELVTNGTFDTDVTGWTAVGSTLSVDIQRLKITNVGTAFGFAYQTFPTVVGKTYKISGSIIQGTASAGYLRAGTSTTGFEYVNFTSTSSGNFTALFVATATTSYVHMLNNNEANAYVIYDNISVKEVPGLHATQSTEASRPMYGIVPVSGRRNLLTQTEALSTPAWANGPTVTVSSGVLDPDSQATAFTLTATAANSEIYQTFTGRTVGQTHTSQVWMRRRTGTGTIRLYANTASTTVAITSSWQLVTLTQNATATTVFFGVSIVTSGDAIDVWHPQFETGSTATAYQRVSTDLDVTEAGVASVGYLRFDGSTSFMLTPTITPGTDKVQVFAGVRKLSDAAQGCVVEHSAGMGGNDGSFAVWAPPYVNGGFAFWSKGTGLALNAYTDTPRSPTSNVLSGLGNISGDQATLRVNGTQVAQDTADQGTGNYLAHQIYIGRRGGTSFALNGQLFPIIVRFGPTLTAARIAATEAWMATKTAGVTLP